MPSDENGWYISEATRRWLASCDVCRRCGAEQVFVDTRRNRRGGAWQDAYDWPVGWEATAWGKEGKRRQQARQRAKRQAAQQLVDARRWLANHA